MPCSWQKTCRPRLRHDGSHHGVSGQLSLLLQSQAAGGHDLVAVDHARPVSSTSEAAVRVAVKGDAEIIAARLHHGPGQAAPDGWSRSPSLMFTPSGSAVDHVGLQVGEAVKQPRRRGGGGAVGAVHQNAQARKVAVHAWKPGGRCSPAPPSRRCIDAPGRSRRGSCAAMGASRTESISSIRLLQLVGELDSPGCRKF